MLKKFALVTALAFATTSLAAHAASISGDISIDGNDSFTAPTGSPAIGTLTFENPATIGGGAGANTGAFSILTNGNLVTMFPLFPGPLPYMLGENTVPAAISPVDVMTTSEAGVTFDFYMTDYNASIETDVFPGCTNATCLFITGDGFFTGTGYDSSPGTFTFTTQETTGQTSATFSASGIATPVPEPGSLALLGTGLAAIAGFARRRLIKA